VIHNPPVPPLLWAEDTRIAGNINGKLTKRIVCTLTTESAGGNDFTCGKELLNFRKNGHLYKTNHPGFTASVRQPSPLAKTNGKPTKRIVLTLTTAEVTTLGMEESCWTPGKIAILCRTNHPGFPHALPPMTRSEWSVSPDTDSSQRSIVGSQQSGASGQDR